MVTIRPVGATPAPRSPSPFDELAELWDEFAEAMDRGGNPARDWLAGQLPGGGRALDVGCGNGRLCRMAAKVYRDVLGVDSSARMLEIAGAKANPPGVRYERHDARELTPRLHGRFDAVFTMNSLFAMGPLAEVLPVLRDLVTPGGRLVLLDVTAPEDGPADEESLSFRPFEIAHTVYRMSGDPEGAFAALRYMLHPAWRELSAPLAPPTPAEVRRVCAEVIPGARVTADVVPAMTGVLWQAPPAG